MPLAIQKKSCGSVKTFWLNKALIDKKLKDSITKMLSRQSEIEDVVLFGSYAEDKAAVSSDIDIMLIVKNSNKRFIDRAIDYYDYFDDIGLNVDIFVYTVQEINKGSHFIEKALSKGIHFKPTTPAP